MSRENQTLITNVDFVDVAVKGSKNARLWAHAVLIDGSFKPKEDAGLFESVRQIRGLTTDGVGVFTFWINPETEVKFQDAQGSMIMMRDSGFIQQSGLIVRADTLEFAISKEDWERPIQVEKMDRSLGEWTKHLNDRIRDYWKAPAMPVHEWVPTGK